MAENHPHEFTKTPKLIGAGIGHQGARWLHFLWSELPHLKGLLGEGFGEMVWKADKSGDWGGVLDQLRSAVDPENSEADEWLWAAKMIEADAWWEAIKGKPQPKKPGRPPVVGERSVQARAAELDRLLRRGVSLANAAKLMGEPYNTIKSIRRRSQTRARR